MELSHPPPVRVYFGVVTGRSSDEGDCNSLTFDFEGVASWDGISPFKAQGVKCFNLPTCDVKVTAPEVGTPASYWEVQQNGGIYKGFLMIWGLQTPFEDCA